MKDPKGHVYDQCRLLAEEAGFACIRSGGIGVHEQLEHDHLRVHDEHHRHEHSPDDPPGEPHSHSHRHEPLRHNHPRYPDIHHRHGHSPQ